jgi:hypothetical protein
MMESLAAVMFVVPPSRDAFLLPLPSRHSTHNYNTCRQIVKDAPDGRHHETNAAVDPDPYTYRRD